MKNLLEVLLAVLIAGLFALRIRTWFTGRGSRDYPQGAFPALAAILILGILLLLLVLFIVAPMVIGSAASRPPFYLVALRQLAISLAMVSIIIAVANPVLQRLFLSAEDALTSLRSVWRDERAQWISWYDSLRARGSLPRQTQQDVQQKLEIIEGRIRTRENVSIPGLRDLLRIVVEPERFIVDAANDPDNEYCSIDHVLALLYRAILSKPVQVFTARELLRQFFYSDEHMRYYFARDFYTVISKLHLENEEREDDMLRLEKVAGEYLTIQQMQEIISGAGGETLLSGGDQPSVVRPSLFRSRREAVLERDTYKYLPLQWLQDFRTQYDERLSKQLIAEAISTYIFGGSGCD